MNEEGRKIVFSELVTRRYALWLDGTKTAINVTTKTIEEWANVFYTYVNKFELFDSLYTIYEFRKGDLATGQEFLDLNENICFKAFEVLKHWNKVRLFDGTAGIDDTGVKFIRPNIDN